MKYKVKDMFEELTFTDIFETFDEEYLAQMANKNPDQLRRMCVFLTLDEQLRKEQYAKKTDKKHLN
jgi:hypothetical protein